MTCRCGIPQCRKLIRSIQFLPESLFKKYEYFVSPYLRDAYYQQKVVVRRERGESLITAKRSIAKGERVFTVEGPTITYAVPPHYSIGYRWLGLRKNTWLIPYKNNPWFSMRHSCNPNTGINDWHEVVALRTIPQGEEVTIDSSIVEADPAWNHPCHCGSKNCRKVMRPIQHLPSVAYKRYAPFVPSFFQKIYLRNRVEQ